MNDLFKTIPKSLPPKSPDEYESKHETTIMAVGGECFMDNINSKICPIKRRQLIKSSKSNNTKSRKI